MTDSHTHPHPGTEHEASNGGGTVSSYSSSGGVLDHSVLDGSTEDYGLEGAEKNPRFGQENPELVRDTETGEETPIPDETK
ncbi:hypothetical protein [Leucobacter sp. USHLN153]|uniref:hypothetical protein n=1 Tax=Leucobacter sp. USHLN153 TaxID=3081268 RepID=UPI003017E608